MAIVLACIAPEMAANIWDRVRPMVDRGYAAGGHIMPDDLLGRIRDGRTLLWCAIEDANGIIVSVMTTELVPMRDGLVCWMNQCAGERMSSWLHFIEKIEEYAKAEGCVRTVLQGRPGWQRVMKDYRVRTVQLEKIL